MRALLLAPALLLAACAPDGVAVAPGPAADPGPATAQASATALALPLRMVGTEPFWGGLITGEVITLSGADRPDLSFSAADRVVTGTGARWRARSAGGVPLELTLLNEPCSDGMSDRRYPFAVTAVLGRETLRGCAMTEAEFVRRRPA